MINQIYQKNCIIPSDINEHLQTLKKLAEKSNSFTEIGVRTMV